MPLNEDTGGTPTCAISFACADQSRKDLERIKRVYKSGQFSPGPMCREFEDRFKELHGKKYAFFVNSGTDALRLGLLALKEKYQWPDGSGVIVPSVTFVASVNVILQANLKPIFVHVGMYDYNLNPWAMEHLLSCVNGSPIVAVMPVHLFGQIADMKEIMRVARKYKLRVIEDSCESVFSEQDGKKCGTFGDVSCFSTYQCHILATGVGGIAMTDSAELNELMRSYGNHGRDPAYLPGFRTPPLSANLISRRFRFVRSGYSCRPSEFEAALGIGQLERLESNLKARRRIAELLILELSRVRNFILPVPEKGKTHSYMMFPIVISEGSKIRKNKLCLFLEKSGVQTRDMMPITNQPVFKGICDQTNNSVADWVNANGFYIPCHQGMTKEDVYRIRDVILDFLKK